MLIDSNSEKFCFAVILSAWINPTRKSIYKYTLFSTLTSNLLKWKWLVRLQGNYWNYSQDQINYLVNYSTKITAEVYSSFFTNTLKFSDLKNYSKLDLPILAICGGNELKDMKQSLDLLSINSNCKTMIIKNGNHNFPMKKYKELNSILNEFIETNSDN